MKTKNLKRLKFLVIILFLIFSCKKEISDQITSENLSTQAAKAWFGNALSSLDSLKSPISVKGTKLKLKPDWNNAIENKQNEFETVEVPILSLGQFGISTVESKQVYDNTGDLRYLQSTTKLVILKTKKEKKLFGFMMTMIPQKSFRKSASFDGAKSSYKKWQDGYSGYVLYHNLDGSFSNGWEIADGKIVGTVTQQCCTNIKVQFQTTKSYQSCTDYYLVHTYQDCTDWYTNGVYTNTACGAPYQVWEYLYTTCTGGGGSGGGGGNGGYNPPSPSQPERYTAQSGDKFSKPNLNPTMTPQLPNLCVPAIMEYVSHNLCGGNTNQGVYILDYWQTYGENVIETGVSAAHIQAFVENHFTTAAFDGYANAINSGKVVMTNIASNITNSSHNVLVVGYHPDGTLIYMDPDKGTLQQGSSSDFGSLYSVPIVNCQPL